MFSLKLKSRTVTVDLYKLTVADVRDLLDVKKKPHDGDVILSKALGMTPEELESMPYPEYRKVTKFFWQCVNDPLKDEDDAKNSQSESTLE
jgi:hypothetical protein